MKRSNKDTGYERLAERVKRTGEYELVLPLDYLLLDAMPVEGTIFAGLYELGETAHDLNKKVPVSPNIIGGRMRAMELQGLTRKIKSLGSGSSKWTWQATEKGKELVKDWKEQSNGSH